MPGLAPDIRAFFARNLPASGLKLGVFACSAMQSDFQKPA
jgi:hypothetical protein